MNRLFVSRFAAALMIGLSGCQTIVVPPAPRMADGVLQSDQRSKELYLSVIAQLIDYEKYHAALAHLDEFDRLYGSTELSHRLRGDAWLALDNLANAEMEYAAIAGGTLSGYGGHGLGRVAAARGDWPSALAYFEQAVRTRPTSPDFLNDFGCALYRLGRVDEAVFELKKALELSPADKRVSGNLNAILANGEGRFGVDGDVSLVLPARTIEAP